MSFFERLKTEASVEWRAYTEHPFTAGLADGTLPQTAFRHYLVQDYLFLIEFARAYALAVYKSPQLADMREAASGLSAILDVEMNLHVKLCAGWLLVAQRPRESSAGVRRCRPIRAMFSMRGMRGDLLALGVALAPCVIGYAEIAVRLAARPGACVATNPYRAWIERICRWRGRTKRWRRRHAHGWTDLPISMSRPREKPSWSRSSRKRPDSRPIFGKWDGARAVEALSLRPSLEGRQAFWNLVKGLLVEGVDRHLRRPENTRMIERADLQDHSRQTRPAGQDMRAAFGTELPRHGAIEIAACKLFRCPLGVTEAIGRHQ